LAKGEGGKKATLRAIAAVARKLSVLPHRLWVSGEFYKPIPMTASILSIPFGPSRPSMRPSASFAPAPISGERLPQKPLFRRFSFRRIPGFRPSVLERDD
jgi:hypothetical protein